DGLKDADVVIALRLQKERLAAALLRSVSEFYYHYGLNNERLEVAHPAAIEMHPGPINRGVEIAFEVVDGPRPVLLLQVTFAVVVRMAVMSMCMGGRERERFARRQRQVSQHVR